MELSILDAHGLPDGSIVSLRWGPTRRQSPLPCVAPFRLPAGPWPLRIDVLALLGKSQPGASLAKLDAEGCCRVPLEAKDGRPMSVTLQVFEGKSGMRPKTAPNVNKKDLDEPEAEASPNTPVRRRDTEAEARAYLDRHRLHEFMHALFELLLRERPADPYSFIATRFREAAALEPQNQAQDATPIVINEKVTAATPMPLAGPGTPEVLRSNVSTAPSLHREITTAPSPEGALQVTIRTLRGRSLARLVAAPTEPVSSIKTRLESILGVPANAQQLFWWAENMPNDTCLDDHGVPAGSSLHLVFGTRDPRLTRALTGSSDGGLKLWNLEDGELIEEYQGGSVGSAVIVAMSVDWETNRVFTGAFNGTCNLWDLNTQRCVSTMEGHKEEVMVLDAHWPSMRAATGAGDGTAKLWDLEKASCLQTYMGGSTVYAIAIDWNVSKCVFGGLRNGSIRMWNMSSGAILRDFKPQSSAMDSAPTAVSAVAIDCHGNKAVSGFEDGHLAYWSFNPSDDEEAKQEKPAQAKVHLAHYSAIRTIAAKWTGTDRRALCGSDDGSLSLWRLDSQECLARFGRHIGFVWTLYANWSRDRALSGAFDGCMKIWDLRTGECLRTLQAHSRPVRSIAGGG